ncbi:MAG: hypothetical protein J1F43_03190 [Muribaculaceae bacterium]|nr:hypothetical protein [Muribaculaceae bacterium]
MKKFLLSIAAVAALSLAANATEVTFDFTTSSYGLTPYDADLGNETPYIETPATITQGDVTIELNGETTKDGTGWRMWNDGLREYYKRNPSFTVSVKGTNVRGVEWTVVSGATFALEGTEQNITSWSGDQASVTFVCTATANKAVKTIKVIYGEDFSATPQEVKEFASVTAAVEYLENGGADVLAKVSGVVYSVDKLGNSGGLSYYIADSTAENATTLQVYYGKGLNGDPFQSKNDLLVGAKVTVQGTLTLYKGANGNTPEFADDTIILDYDATGIDAPEVPGAPTDIITVAEAIELVNKGYQGTASVKGIISTIEGYDANYKSISYVIVDKEGDSNSLRIYSGKGLDGADFTSENDLAVGATVVVKGELQDYKGTVEMNYNSVILSYEAAGIEGIEADSNAPAVYYNLQGVKVQNPEKGGLYIIRQGNKSVKTIIR